MLLQISNPVRIVRCKPSLPPLLRPVRLDLLDVQNTPPLRVSAVLQAKMREDIGVVEVGGAVVVGIDAAHSLPAKHRKENRLIIFDFRPL